MKTVDARTLNWNRHGGLLPAIVQHWRSGEVLMLGWMSPQSLELTQRTARVTFWSRSKRRLWMKGETSGHVLETKAIHGDCDADAVLITAKPRGPTCHLGARSCFGDDSAPPLAFLDGLDALIAQRHAARPAGSYVAGLFDAGVQRIAQKLGEEGVETALAAVSQDDDALLDEAADLLFHLLVLLRARGLSLQDAAARLARRRAQSEDSPFRGGE